MAESSAGKCAATTYPCTQADRSKCATACPAGAVIDAGAPPPGPAPGPVDPDTGVVPTQPPSVCPTVESLVIQISGGQQSGPHGHGAFRWAATAIANGKVKPRPCVAWKAFGGNITDAGDGNAMYWTKTGAVSIQACALPKGKPCASVKQ